MPEYVRVRLDNGDETTVTAAKAAADGLNVLEEPATDARGVRPVTRNGRRPKPRVQVEQAAAKGSAQPAKKKTSASTAAKPDTSGDAADQPKEQS